MADYPELEALGALSRNGGSVVRDVFNGRRLIDENISDIGKNLPVEDMNSLLKWQQVGLDIIDNDFNHRDFAGCERFFKAESELLKQSIQRVTEVIGDKKRGSDGVYR